MSVTRPTLIAFAFAPPLPPAAVEVVALFFEPPPHPARSTTSAIAASFFIAGESLVPAREQFRVVAPERDRRAVRGRQRALLVRGDRPLRGVRAAREDAKPVVRDQPGRRHRRRQLVDELDAKQMTPRG